MAMENKVKELITANGLTAYEPEAHEGWYFRNEKKVEAVYDLLLNSDSCSGEVELTEGAKRALSDKGVDVEELMDDEDRYEELLDACCDSWVLVVYEDGTTETGYISSRGGHTSFTAVEKTVEECYDKWVNFLMDNELC